MKKLIVLCLVLFLLAPTQVFAHSKLTKSTPENNDILSVSPEMIAMEFNTDIATISTFTLVNEQGETVDIEQMSVEGNRLSGIPTSPLVNSSYTVKWTIIGADGHTIEGNFTFKVNAIKVNAPEPTATTSTPAPSPAVVDENDLDVDETGQSSTNNIVLPIAIIAIIISLAVIFATKRNKK